MKITRFYEIAEEILKNDPFTMAYVDQYINNLTESEIDYINFENYHDILNGASDPERYARTGEGFCTTYNILKVHFPEKSEKEIEQLFDTCPDISEKALQLEIIYCKIAFNVIGLILNFDNYGVYGMNKNLNKLKNNIQGGF